MTRYVNPSLLQLGALGIKDDHYLPDGRHLRWTFSPDLGFPRSGFRLVRRPSPLPWDPKRQDVSVRRAFLRGSYIVNDEIRHQAGLHVTADDGLDVTIDSNGTTRTSVGSDVVRIRFTEDGSQTAAPTPACWVLLQYRHNQRIGSIAASAVFTDGGTVRVQDRGASGQEIIEPLGRLIDTFDLDSLRRFRDIAYLPTLTDARVDDAQLEQRIVETAVNPELDLDITASSPFHGSPYVDWDSVFDGEPISYRPSSDEWVSGTFLLNGSVIDEIHVTGKLADIELIEWITVDDYVDADGWQPVETFFLPVDGDDVTYPAQPTAGKAIARQRLEHAPPKALGPWDNKEWPPDPSSEAAIEHDRETRYLNGYDDLADALETLVATEVREAKPQRTVQYGGDEPMQTTEGTNDDLSGSMMGVPLLDMLQVASLDPGVAHMLGLATADFDAGSGQVDYMVSADWWMLWLWGILSPSSLDQTLETYAERQSDENGLRLPLPSMSGTGTYHGRVPSSQYATVVSVTTGVAVASHDAVPSPTGLNGEVKTRPGVSDVPAVVKLSWNVTDANLFTDDGHVAFAVRRRHNSHDESLARADPDSAIPLPRLPASGSPIVFTDHTPLLGDSTYRVSGMDIWGRWSDFAETTETVIDTVPPPSPTGLRARLIGDDEPIWDLELSFDWTSGQRVLAPDTTRFEVHCEQGKVDHAFAGWNGCETSESVRSPLSISWSDLVVSTPLSNVTATINPSGAANDPSSDARVTITIPDMHAPFNTDHRARISATVVAVDESGNVSDPARRTVAERIDPVEPATEPLALEPQVATWPDADGKCYWIAEWKQQPTGSRTQVLRAPQARLLAAADESLATFESRDTIGRIQRLRAIAADQTNQHAFSPDHEEPYDNGETRHQVSLPAEDRGLTVVTIRHTGPTGTRSPWSTEDDCFAVVRTPPTTQPLMPNLVATTDADAPSEIQLTVAPDASGATETIRIYRTQNRDAVSDVRRMRPLTPLTASETDSLVVQDAVPPDRWYVYRAIAHSPSGLRSPPTAPVWVRANTNQPPTPPVILNINQPTIGSPNRKIEIQITGYGLTVRLERRLFETGSWSTVEVWNLENSTEIASPRIVTASDRVPQDKANAVFEYRAEAVDRRGARSISTIEV